MDVLNESDSCLTCGAPFEEVRRDHRLITENVVVRAAPIFECTKCDAYEVSLERLGELLALVARERALHAMPLEARLCRRADETTWWSVVPSLSVEDCLSASA